MKGVVLMAEQQKYSGSWQSLPCSPYCRHHIKWVGCICPWQIIAPILLGPQSEPGIELTFPESDIKHHSPITIKVTGLENLYRKDDKYISKGNVLFNLEHILISVDCRSPSKIKLSSFHDRNCKIAVNWLLDVNERDTEYMSAWVRVITYIEYNHLYNPLVYKKSISHATLANPTKTTHVFPCVCSSHS